MGAQWVCGVRGWRIEWWVRLANNMMGSMKKKSRKKVASVAAYLPASFSFFAAISRIASTSPGFITRTAG